MSSIELVLLEADEEVIEELADACKELREVKIQKVDRVHYTHPPSGLDAVFLVLPAAEKWGARPIPGKAQVLETSNEDRGAGMPAHIVTGVVLLPDDPRGPIPETKILVSAALRAVHEYNQENRGGAIRKLGFWAVNLLRGVTPRQLSTILRELLLPC